MFTQQESVYDIDQLRHIHTYSTAYEGTTQLYKVTLEFQQKKYNFWNINTIQAVPVAICLSVRLFGIR